ncbi:hypothetical protein JOD54_004517 [Actinokineospora baliensis]|uniref:hypothetical protein n=1 Tax=Actinokineospora baliensis TaxID=547056 RepID=UPI00195C5A38|nr:hypothetical protein [Actinokineospora baliensis]MBM7774313.1 hypothetical protein [Actinokineospora baliensis]
MIQNPTVDVYTTITSGCAVDYEINNDGGVDFTFGGRLGGGQVMTFSRDSLSTFADLARTVLLELSESSPLRAAPLVTNGMSAR